MSALRAPEERPPLAAARRVAVAGIAISGFLAFFNILVGALAESTSVLAIGLEFAGDVLTSSVVLFGLRVASRPADDDHPYGHGRFETLSAFIVGTILLAGGVGICISSLQAIGAVHAPPGAGAVASLAVAIALRALMSVLKFRIGRRSGSAALVADAWNDAVDILSAGGALTAVALSNYDPARFLAADHYGGFVVGMIVAGTGIRVMRDASLDLVDTMPPEHFTRALEAVAVSVPGVVGVEKRFARKTGLQYHVDLHIEVDPQLTVAASHDIASEVRITLKRDLPWVADVLVHVEPAGLGQEGAAASPRGEPREPREPREP